MNDRKFTLAIGGSALATMAIGLGMFLYVGSQIGVYVLLLGIPTVIVGGTIAYVQRSKPSGGQKTTRYFEDKAQQVGERMRSLLVEYDRLLDRLDDWDGGETHDEISYVVDRFDDAGVEFDRSTNRFQIRGGGDLREIERLDTQVDELRTELAESAHRHVTQERETCIEAQERLRTEGLIDRVREPDDVPVGDPDAILSAMAAFDTKIEAAVDDAVETLQTLAERNDRPADQVERGAGNARSSIERGEYAAAAGALVETRDRMEGDLATTFESERKTLESVLETVKSSIASEYVDPALRDELDEIERELDGIDSALEHADLEALSEQTRKVCTKMVTEMADELDEHLATLSTASVPEDYYEYQSVNDETYDSDLRTAGDLNEYRRTWLTAVGELSEAIDAVEMKASVAEAYPTVRDDIEEVLRARGRVEPDDLKVKQAEEFLELYAADHQDATFRSNPPALTTDGAGEAYALTVQAGFPEGGPKRGIDIDLNGPEDDTRSFETHLLDIAEFEELPYGEYTISVTTPEDGYADEERTVTLDDDEEVEVTLPEVTIRESVCEGIEEEAEAALDDAESLFSDEYEESEYLSDSMDFPMTAEYVPCMLALWAERQGLTVREVDGSVLVYDGEQFQNRLQNIVDHNLSAGESITYTDVRNRYLAVPASVNLIIETLRESDIGSEIEYGDDELIKR
ncbi:hypothetical protein JCM17823_07150 [Halorubrum gandharaense]